MVWNERFVFNETSEAEGPTPHLSLTWDGESGFSRIMAKGSTEIFQLFSAVQLFPLPARSSFKSLHIFIPFAVDCAHRPVSHQCYREAAGCQEAGSVSPSGFSFASTPFHSGESQV